MTLNSRVSEYKTIQDFLSTTSAFSPFRTVRVFVISLSRESTVFNCVLWCVWVKGFCIMGGDYPIRLPDPNHNNNSNPNPNRTLKLTVTLTPYKR